MSHDARPTLLAPLLPLAALVAIGCSDVCGSDRLPSCDIREESCQDVVIDTVACMRGATVEERPPVTLTTPSSFEAELRAGADPMMMQTLQWEGALHRLGMLSPEVSLFDAQVESAVASVGAYFSPSENAVFVIDRGMPADSPDSVAILLHEMVHAVQHQEHDLEARLMEAETHEQAMRARLAIEGEATFYQLEALLWADGYRPAQLDWGAFFDDWILRTRDALDLAPSPYFVVYGQLPYVLGSRYAADAWQNGDDEAVRAMLADRPLSSAFMRDPYTLEDPPPERLTTNPCDAPPAPAGFDASFEDEMGPQLIYAFLRAGGRMSHAEAWGIAYRWRRDALYVYGAPDGRVAVAWRIFMDDTSGPRWVAADVVERGFAGSADGSVVTILAAEPTTLADWTWTASGSCAFP